MRRGVASHEKIRYPRLATLHQTGKLRAMSKKRTTKPKTVADQLRAALESSGLSNAQLAELSGVHHSVLSRFCRGITEPTMPNVEKLVVALDLRLVPAYMVMEEDED